MEYVPSSMVGVLKWLPVCENDLICFDQLFKSVNLDKKTYRGHSFVNSLLYSYGYEYYKTTDGVKVLFSHFIGRNQEEYSIPSAYFVNENGFYSIADAHLDGDVITFTFRYFEKDKLNFVMRYFDETEFINYEVFGNFGFKPSYIGNVRYIIDEKTPDKNVINELTELILIHKESKFSRIKK